MSVQRQMRAVNGNVVFHQHPQDLIALARPGAHPAPEKTVMDHQQIRAGITSHFDGARTDIHRGGDPRDLAGVLHLQAVHGFGPVLEFLHLQQSLAIGHDFFQ